MEDTEDTPKPVDKRLGNQFWRARAKHGRDKIFKTPEQLWNAACEYFDWVEENPLWETKSYQYQGVPVQDTIPKMRAMTLEGICLFLHVNTKYFYDFEGGLDLSTQEGKDFSEIISKIKEIIRNQKFSGAAADLLNANIIARDLGLRDKSELDHKSSDGSMTPKPAIDASKLSDATIEELLNARSEG